MDKQKLVSINSNIVSSFSKESELLCQADKNDSLLIIALVHAALIKASC